MLFAAPIISTLSEEQVMRRLGKPARGAVRRRDGGPIQPSMPHYLVRPATFHGSETEVRIVDLGQGRTEHIPQISTMKLTQRKLSSTMNPQIGFTHHGICARLKLFLISR